MAETVASDENISQFLSFTGSSDPAKAASYLEMSGNNVETAVGLYMEHETTGGGGGGGTGGGGGGSGNAGGNMAGAGGFGDEDGIRAPDETRSMQLMPGGGDEGGMMMMGGFHPAYQMMNEMTQAQLDQAPNSAFASPSARRPGRGGRAAANNRALLDQAIAAQAQGVNVSGYLGDTSMMDDDDFPDEDDDADYEESKTKEPARLSDMFAAPSHIMHVAGGFQGARTMAKDTKRWLLVNIQRDAEFASHALNRDVWRDELVENLIREGFIFWQQMDTHPDGQTYCQRYKVYNYPHLAIIDPRTGRLMWSKEGWTLENPVTAETFSEMAMDFCSRNSLDRPPQAPKVGASAGKRPATELSEAEQLKAALQASMKDSGKASKEGSNNNDDDDDDDDGDEYQYDDDVAADTDVEDAKPTAVSTTAQTTKPPPLPPPPPPLVEQLRAFVIPEEPKDGGARVQIKLADGKRAVRTFSLADPVRTVYAYIVQSNEAAGGGREFSLMAGYPPRDLFAEIDTSIEEARLKGEAITMRWKD